MISAETTESFLAEFSNSKDPNKMLNLLGDFYLQEPQFAAFMTIFCGNLPVDDQTAMALLAVTLYEKMRTSQESADALKRKIR